MKDGRATVERKRRRRESTRNMLMSRYTKGTSRREILIASHTIFFSFTTRIRPRAVAAFFSLRSSHAPPSQADARPSRHFTSLHFSCGVVGFLVPCTRYYPAHSPRPSSAVLRSHTHTHTYQTKHTYTAARPPIGGFAMGGTIQARTTDTPLSLQFRLHKGTLCPPRSKTLKFVHTAAAAAFCCRCASVPTAEAPCLHQSTLPPVLILPFPPHYFFCLASPAAGV